MNLYLILTSAAILFLSIALGGGLLLKKGVDGRNVTFSLFAASIAVWSGGYLFWQFAESAPAALVWCRVLVAGSIFIPITYLHFVSKVTGYQIRPLLQVGYVVAFLLLVASPTRLIVSGVGEKLMFSFWPEPGLLFPAYFFFFASITIIAFVFLAKRHRSAPPQVRNQLHYLILGTLLGFIGGSTNFLLWLDIPVPPIGNGLGILYVLGVGYSIIKFRLMELNQMILNVTGFIATAFLLSVVGAFASYYFFRLVPPDYDLTHPHSHWVLAFGGSLFLLWLLPLIRGRVAEFLDAAYIRHGGRYRHRLKALAQDLVGFGDEKELFQRVLSEIVGALGLTRGAIYFRGEFDLTYELVAQKGMSDDGLRYRTLRNDHPVVAHLKKSRSARLQDEIVGESLDQRKAPTDTEPFKSHDFFIPILGDNLLLGILMLGSKGHNRIYTDSTISLLEAICFQVGLSIRSRQLERRANQADKLISLGTLAAGLAHELKNPLVSIQTFTSLQNGNGADSPGSEFREVVQRDVQRIVGIVENVAAFAEKSSVEFAPVHIREVVKAAYEIVQPEFERANLTFSLDAGDVAPVAGNHNQLTQVFINLLQNAVQASRRNSAGLVKVCVRQRVSARQEPFVWIEVSDEGPGIEAGIIGRIFEPFVTTKSTGSEQAERGMGLGLAIVKRIVECHSGVIEVESAPGSGARFLLSLPCAETRLRK